MSLFLRRVGEVVEKLLSGTFQRWVGKTFSFPFYDRNKNDFFRRAGWGKTEPFALGNGRTSCAGRVGELGLNDAELAFYDALETNDSAVMELGDETLKAIARDLVKAVRNSVTIDWTMKETVRAKIRTMVKRILRKHD
jgi:hypothetical protein